MKKKIFSSLVGCALVLSLLAGVTLPLVSASSVTLEFLSPKGEIEIPYNQPLAERLTPSINPATGEYYDNAFSGKTILLLFYSKDSGTAGQNVSQAIRDLMSLKYENITWTTATLSDVAWEKGQANYDLWASRADASIIGETN